MTFPGSSFYVNPRANEIAAAIISRWGGREYQDPGEPVALLIGTSGRLLHAEQERAKRLRCSHLPLFNKPRRAHSSAFHSEGWLTIAAIVLGPIIASWLKRLSDRRRDDRARKLWVFRELMGNTRHAAVIQARGGLNLIDLELRRTRRRIEKSSTRGGSYLASLGYTPADREQHAAFFQPRDAACAGVSGGGRLPAASSLQTERVR